MNDEKDMDVGEEKEAGSGPAQAVPDYEAGAAGAEHSLDATAAPSPPLEAAVSPGGDVKAGNTKGSGFKGYIADHKLLLGLCIGALAVMIIAGVFIAGYLVGRPCDRHAREDLPLRSQPFIPDQQQPDLRSVPSPGPGGPRGGPYGVVEEYRDEIEGVIAAKLGMSTSELRDEINSGKTIAEIAEEKGVANEELTAAVAAKISEIADRLAADGDITAERAEKIKSDAEDIASRLIEKGWRLFMMPHE